ncbi:MAG: LysM peptidoglycan-binding domain-containing protein, partial [Bacteroidales bacterium]|nr:LysM peptidoglycan-binding domain-containing protein [Bacteroidales bacterium]
PVMVSTVKEQAKTSSTITYVVKKGDYLGRIASRYRVSVAQLKRWNNLRSDNIRVGQRLYIHR